MSKNTVHILMLLSFFLFPGWADTWEDIRRNSEKVQSVNADFVQEKHMKILKKPLVSKGIFCFQSPDSLRWEYREPVQSILLSHKGKTKRFVKGKEGFVRQSADGLQAMTVVMAEIRLWMRGQFAENPNFTATLEPGPKILLRPKQESFSKIIQRIELVLSPDRPGIIDHVSVHESGDSRTKIIFQNVKINEKMADSLFQDI
ncbi:MAG: outer membrane lipoprotein carrier protein LolA [Desulfobacterales bacterium]